MSLRILKVGSDSISDLLSLLDSGSELVWVASEIRVETVCNILKEKYSVTHIPYNPLQLTQISKDYLRYFDRIYLDSSEIIRDTFSCLRYLKDSAQLIIQNSQSGRWVDYLKTSILFNYSEGILHFKRPRSAVCCVSVGEEYRKQTQKCRKSLSEYCYKWEIPFLEESESLDLTRPIPWSKIKLLQKHLDSYEVLVWIDADVFISNSEHSLDERMIFLTRNKHMLLSRDLNGINTGIFLIRNTPKMVELLDTIYSRTQFINHCFWEQGALMDILRTTNWNTYIQTLPFQNARLLNSYKDDSQEMEHRRSDWLVHFAGKRKDKLAKYVDEINSFETSGLSSDDLNNLVSISERVW